MTSSYKFKEIEIIHVCRLRTNICSSNLTEVGSSQRERDITCPQLYSTGPQCCNLNQMSLPTLQATPTNEESTQTDGSVPAQYLQSPMNLSRKRCRNSPMCPQPSAFLPKIHQYDSWPPWQTSASRSHEDSPGLPSDRSLWPMSLRLLLHCLQSGLQQYHLCNTYQMGQCISIPFLSWDCSWVNTTWLERVQKLHLMADVDLLCFELLTVSLFDATPKGRELHKTESVRAPHLIHIGTHQRVCLLSILIR